MQRSIVWLVGILFLYSIGNPAVAAPVPGEFVVKFRPAGFVTEPSAVQRLVASAGGMLKELIPEFNLAVIRIHSPVAPEPFLNALRAQTEIAYVEPNVVYSAQRIPDDPQFSSLWGLVNTGQKVGFSDGGTPGMDINVQKAWDIETGSPDILVAVIDTGVKIDHPDLTANIWVNEREKSGRPGVDDDGNGYVDDVNGYNFSDGNGDVSDGYDHGTHVAGTISAQAGNGVGIAGVSWHSRILPVKFMDTKGNGDVAGAIKSIAYAIKAGARIINCSWGGDPYSKALEGAIAEAHRAGILVVASAGNNGDDNDRSTSPNYPASYKLPNVISVGYTNNRGQRELFSSYGKTSVHLAAPGRDILSASASGGYRVKTGSSMAAPHVAGVAALLLSREPRLSPEAVKERLMRTARPLPELEKFMASGLVDAFAALTTR